MKVFSIAVALLLAVAVAPGAAAKPEPTTIDRIIAQENAKGLADEDTSLTLAERIIAQEEGRYANLGGSRTASAVVIEESRGFDWADAGIGAAAAFALVLLTAGGLALARDGRRGHRYGESRA